MGTRNLTIVLKNGEHKVAQYCQWDGYPEGQGTTALSLLRECSPVIEQSLDKCRWITEEEMESAWRVAHEACNEEFLGLEHGVTFDVSNAMKELYPHLQRDHGALVLDTIVNAADEIALNNQINFAADDVFCEWIWIVDFDNRLFQGFEPTRYHLYDSLENQESYLDTLDMDINMTKVFEASLDNLPASQEEFMALFSRRE